MSFRQMWQKYGWYCVPGYIIFIISAIGSLMWLYHYLQSLAIIPSEIPVTASSISPIDLCVVTATLGGLVLIGAFYKENNLNNHEIIHDLKTVGKLILLSSACFLIFFFGMEYVKSISDVSLNSAERIFVDITAFVAAIALLAISYALDILVTIIRFV